MLKLLQFKIVFLMWLLHCKLIDGFLILFNDFDNFQLTIKSYYYPSKILLQIYIIKRQFYILIYLIVFIVNRNLYLDYWGRNN